MKTRHWDKFINKNKTEGDCQLVSTVNAYYHLTGKTIPSEKYEEFIDLCGCRHGSTMSIEKVWRKLGLKIIKRYDSLFDVDHKEVSRKGVIDYKTIKIPLPMELSVWHKKCGHHSVLIVDHEIKTNCYRITNFPWETNMQGWMFAEDLYKFARSGSRDGKNIYRLLAV